MSEPCMLSHGETTGLLLGSWLALCIWFISVLMMEGKILGYPFDRWDKLRKRRL